MTMLKLWERHSPRSLIIYAYLLKRKQLLTPRRDISRWALRFRQASIKLAFLGRHDHNAGTLSAEGISRQLMTYNWSVAVIILAENWNGIGCKKEDVSSLLGIQVQKSTTNCACDPCISRQRQRYDYRPKSELMCSNLFGGMHYLWRDQLDNELSRSLKKSWLTYCPTSWSMLVPPRPAWSSLRDNQSLSLREWGRLSRVNTRCGAKVRSRPHRGSQAEESTLRFARTCSADFLMRAYTVVLFQESDMNFGRWLLVAEGGALLSPCWLVRLAESNARRGWIAFGGRKAKDHTGLMITCAEYPPYVGPNDACSIASAMRESEIGRRCDILNDERIL